MVRKIYAASSWRNPHQPEVVQVLRVAGHEVYDFRNPPHGRKGFAWSDIDPNWMEWSASTYRAKLDHPLAVEGFKQDWAGMTWADTGVLVLPSGPSSHLEAGWFAGAGRQLFVYMPSKVEPDLMYKMATKVCISLPDLVKSLR
jgi:hypothetical protein